MQNKSTAELVAEIHNDFYSAEERLLQEAKRIVSRPHLELTQKAERASKLGFSASKPARIGNDVKTNNRRNEELLKNITHYRQRYPQNKFITEEEVKRICEKYGLLLGDAERFTGDIPEKNLCEIENFKLLKEDFIEKASPWPWDSLFMDRSMFIPRMRFNINTREPQEKAETHQAPFKIVASRKDFNTADTSVKDGYKLEINIPDPIVLQPVKGGYLIVTAWGEEAGDEAVANEVMN